MNRESLRKKNNKKAISLLLALILLGFLFFKYAKINKIIAVKDSNIEVSSCEQDVVDDSYENGDIFLRIDNDGEMVDVTPSVLGVNASGGGCSIAGNTYSGDSICSTEKESTVAVDGKGYISSSAEVNLISLDVPVVLFSGKYFIKDSNRELTKEDPVYKPLGEIEDKETVYKYTPPGEESDNLKNQIEGVAKNIAYDVNYTLSIDGGEGTGKAQINKYIPNMNEILGNNDSNANPAQSNLLSSILLEKNFLPAEAQDSSNLLEISGMCNNSETVEINALKYTSSCINIFERISGVISSLFPKSDWSNCDEESETCINSETIVVKLSPILKETNEYLDTVARSIQDPATASNYNSVYIITDCKANVAGKSKNIQCLWDLSYLFHERFLAEFDDLGGSNTPTGSDYINFLKKESSTRGEAVFSM